MFYSLGHSENENVLVVNCGSSSIKFQIIEPNAADIKLSGIVERIGETSSKLKYKFFNNGILTEKKEKNIIPHTKKNNNEKSELYIQAFNEISELVKERCVADDLISILWMSYNIVDLYHSGPLIILAKL